MKKIFSLAVVAAAITLASCGGKSTANTAEEDSLNIDTVSTLDEAATPAVLTSLEEKLQSGDAAGATDLITQVTAEMQKYIEMGDSTAAAKYAEQVKTFIEQNAEKLQELNVNTATLTDIVNTVKGLPASAEEAVKGAATGAAGEVVSNAKAKASEKVNEAKQKATDAANSAIDDAAAKAKSQFGL